MGLHALEKPDAEDMRPAEDEEEVDTEAVGETPSYPEEPLLSLTKVAIVDLVSKWTMESGVRNLERRIAQICRWATLRLSDAESQDEGQQIWTTLAMRRNDKER